MMLALLLAAAASLPAPGTAAVQSLGVDRSYVLVLPPGYDASRRWPILYLFDARGRGALAAERFQPAAARFGWVVASSNDSRSDGPPEPNAEAFTGMWNDTQARLALDPRRAYLGGFSGGARFSARAAAVVPGQVAGVIGCGAGFPSGEMPKQAPPFVWYGLVGYRDFNHGEMLRLADALHRLRAPHGLEVFDGAHEWPTSDAATRAVAFLEMRAMAAGLRAPDAVLTQQIAAERRQALTAIDRPGGELEAERTLTRLIAELDGLVDLAPEHTRLAALTASPAFRAQRGAAERAARDELLELQRVQSALARAMADDTFQPPGRLAVDLGLGRLRERAARADPAVARPAQRILAEIVAQAGFYLPRRARDAGDHAKAALMLGVATTAAPQRPDLWLWLAAEETRRGRRKDALRALERAVETGAKGRQAVAADPDLAALRGTPAFDALLARIPE